MSLDEKMTFDSVEHSYIIECLRRVGLGRFVPIFETLYAHLRSDIIINGKIVKGFKKGRGVKKGDAVSCILFIICMEPLLRNISDNEEIVKLRSATLNCDLPVNYAYADDISCSIAEMSSVSITFLKNILGLATNQV